MQILRKPFCYLTFSLPRVLSFSVSLSSPRYSPPHFRSLSLSLSHSLSSSSSLPGCSAGALTAYLHLDYVKTLLTPTTKVAGLADAMFALEYTTWNGAQNYNTNQFSWGFSAWNSSRSVNRACLAHYGAANAWVCMQGAIAVQFLVSPILVVNSRYDTWQARGTLGLDCQATVLPDGTPDLCHNRATVPNATAETAAELKYGDAMAAAALALPKQHGVFLTNCPTHCESDSLGHPSTPGHYLYDVIHEWYAQVMVAGQQPGWVAPRYIAQDGDLCQKKNR